MVPQVTASHFIPTKILVPVDFSSSSDAALETASDLAQHFHAELYLLNVIPMLPMGTKTVSFPETEYLHEAEDNAERQLATCDAALVSKGIKASSSIEIGNDVVGNIMLVIEREHIDMIVISTHGISGWRPLNRCNARCCYFGPSNWRQIAQPLLRNLEESWEQIVPHSELWPHMSKLHHQTRPQSRSRT
jgi:nucleotide-binding universal stress UspA family protein